MLDVRFNGGGYTHDQVLNYLGGKEHTFFYQKSGNVGAVLNFNDRKWSKPLVLLINNRSYSDAEIFPHAFRTLGLGKLVGQPTGGYVIVHAQHLSSSTVRGLRNAAHRRHHAQGGQHGKRGSFPRSARSASHRTSWPRAPIRNWKKAAGSSAAGRRRLEEDPSAASRRAERLQPERISRSFAGAAVTGDSEREPESINHDTELV